jgi:hypothetical protein
MNSISRRWYRYWARHRRRSSSELRSAASIGTPKVGAEETRLYAHLDGTLTTTGNWIASTPIPDQTSESRVTRLDGQAKVVLLTFARKILQWLPEDRASARDLTDPLDEFLAQWNT